MKAAAIILTIILIALAIYIYRQSKIKNYGILPNTTSKECATIPLARAPEGKNWVCSDGTWILI